MAQLVMPKLGLTMTEGLLAEWRAKPGDAFRLGDVLYVVETEKIANEIEADQDGVLAQIYVNEGETVPVGTPIAALEGDIPVKLGLQSAGQNVNDREQQKPQVQASQAMGSIQPRDGIQRIVATPLARRLARSSEVDLSHITGSGPRGRIKAADVEAALGQTTQALAVRPPSFQPATSSAGSFREIVPDAARLATARRVLAAKRDIPHFYLSHEAETSALISLRKSLNNDVVRTRISITHLLIKALGLALAEMPEANQIWLNDKIIAYDQADVGMVTDTPLGLRIPMIRNAGARPMDQISATATDLAERARNDTLTADDVGGGAVSISNIGRLGPSGLTPIINPPHSMILGVGAERQVFRPDELGQPKLSRELTLTLACDHRIHDGALAARFLNHLVSIIETPLSLLRDARPEF